MQHALALHGITKSFGGFTALEALDFSVRPGEVHALLGENGAGKSTLMNVACGLYAPDAGWIEIDGQPTRISGARDAAARGIGMVHQHFKLVPSFSVLDNILLFNPGRPAAEIAAATRDLATRMGIPVDLARRAGTLGIAEQQRVEILKVLVAGARVIILDEPTAVLSDDEGLALMRLMRGLAEAGSAVILVTHKLHEALGFSDRITVIRAGRKIVETTPAESDPRRLTTQIVGETIVEMPAPTVAVGAPRLRFDAVSGQGDSGQKGISNVSFTVRGGEIYGIAGVAGNGQTELAQVLIGLTRASAGRIEVDGRDIAGAAADDPRRRGLAAIPVDRYRHGLAGAMSVVENFAVRGTLAGRYGSWLRFDRRRARRDAAAAIAAFDVRGVRNLSQRAALLSGGNAQKLVIAREFQGTPGAVFAHSPTRGLDVRAGAAVHDRLRAARDAGAAVLVISEDLDEILLLSDRIGVLTGGRLTAEFDAPAERAQIGAAMVHHD
ncbi:MAG: ABC transporter ATP-binding protein [Rhodobacteraceae bacterium]|nr:ABC transporter ATP-binding protein [Paracoccaceae bacterium]